MVQNIHDILNFQEPRLARTGLVSLGSNPSITVRLQDSKLRWGTLESEGKPAVIIYMDIVINQTHGITLKSAVVQLSLHEHQDDPPEPQATAEPLPSHLQFTQWFGPQVLVTEGNQINLKSFLTPEVNILGNGGDELGAMTTRTQRWALGDTISSDIRHDEGEAGISCGRLKWHLRGDMLEGLRPQPNKAIQTAFAVTHTGKPFSLKVDIQGRFQRSTLNYKSSLNYPIRAKLAFRSDPDGTKHMVIHPPDMPATHRLDSLAHTLPLTMQMRNQYPELMTEDLMVDGLEKKFVGDENNWAVFGNVINKKDEKGRTALSVAAGNGHLHVLRMLLSQEGIHLSVGDNEDRTSLSWAAGNGHLKAAELLLDSSKEISPEEASNLTKKDKSGRTPLSYACGNGHLDMVNMLLGRTADLEVADNEGRVPLAWAAKEGREDIVIRILEHYAEKNIVVHDHLITASLSLAALNDHLPIMRILVQAGLEASTNKRTWLNVNLKRAIEDGKLSLVKVMFQYEASADMQFETLDWIPLCVAAANGHASIIHFLLDSGAKLDDHGIGEETALYLASQNGKEEAVRVLLNAGADIYFRNSNGRTVMEAAENHPMVLRMISEKDKDGRLAESDPQINISQEFHAKSVFFAESPSGLKVTTKDVLVSKLLADPSSIKAPEHGEVNFKWFHLPENNMRWAEALIFAHYGNRSSVYKVLKPDLWVGRQHLGDANAHQARFMQPICQSFGPVAAQTQEQQLSDKDMVVFMPYLHWEESKRLDATKEVISKGAEKKNISHLTREQRILYTQLFEDDPHPLHLVHIRRTLDQFGYYTLDNTDKRDKDQTVIRHQRKFKLEPQVTVMVDQLWMWVLVGPSGRADTVISCFPTNDGTQVRSGADPDGFTEVLQNIMIYMLEEPHVIKNAYDLAGVIASRCSRTFLGASRAPKSLQFGEIYQSAISSIVNKETELFDTFRTLTELRRRGPYLADEILETLIKLKDNTFVNLEVINKLLRKSYNDTLNQGIPDSDDMTAIFNRRILDITRASEALEKLGNFHALDISREITLLREIKDIQDELNIMIMVLEEQTGVLKDMERIVRSIEKAKRSNLLREISKLESTRMAYNNRFLTSERSSGATDISSIAPSENGNHASADGTSEEIYEDAPEFNDTMSHETAPWTIDQQQDARFNRRDLIDDYIEESLPTSEIWGSSQDTKYSSLPLSTVQLSVDEIERMSQRAKKANNALDFLVDLKQKQSNVLDARSARIQAEESLKMTKEAEKQGKTIMVFTIVTIVFLPMSFMAAFFAINITQFPRDAGGTMDLGYVLEIMIPISAVVSFSFILIAFKAGSFQGIVSHIGGLLRSR